MIHVFDSTDKKRIKSHLRNIITIANSDGKIDASEKACIEKIGNKFGLTHEEMHQLIDHPSSQEFHPPIDLEEKYEFLYDLAMMIMADGNIDDIEMKIFKSTIISLSLDYKKSDQIIKYFIDMVNNKTNPETAFKSFKRILLS